MIQNRKIRVLWITDIHFSSQYSAMAGEHRPKFDGFLDAFFNIVVDEHKNAPIDYILLTGDLAQMGLENDYEALKDLMLDPLLTRLKDTKLKSPTVFTIPGNHDVMWKQSAFLGDYIDHISTKKKIELDRPKYLATNQTKFRALFTDYTAFVKREKAGKFKDFYLFPKGPAFESSSEYDESGLFGYFVDRSHKLVFIFINTAWFSQGDGINPVFIQYIKETEGFDELVTEEKLNDWLVKKDYLTEYGKQILGIQMLFKKDGPALRDLFINYPDYFVVTAMHHSRNWLEWSEKLTYKNAPEDSATLLALITDNSNVVLTGHEHVPINSSCERLSNNILHLKGGCMLEYNQLNRIERKDNYNNNWFSLLEIDLGSKIIDQIKFIYDSKVQSWKALDEKEPFATAKEYDYILTDMRKIKVLHNYAKSGKQAIKDYLTAYFNPAGKSFQLAKLSSFSSKKYHLYHLVNNGEEEFCILAQESNLYFTYFNQSAFFNDLIAGLKKHPKVKSVRFLVLDLLVDGDLQNEYASKDFKRDDSFNRIVKLADNLFDIFRHAFICFGSIKHRTRATKEAVNLKITSKSNL